MIDELRARFRTRFIDTARGRVRRALALIGEADGARELMTELHSLAGEAALLGLAEISEEARSGELAAKQWAEGDAAAKLRCVRAVRAVSRAVEDFAAADPDQPDDAPADRAGDSRRVLVVDDSSLSGEQVADALARAGITTELAADADAALESVRRFAPRAVLSDVHMPGIELDRLCSDLRREAAGPLLIILLSGMADDRLAERAREVGADGYITKQRGTDFVVERLQLILEESNR